MIIHSCAASLPPDRRGRLRNGATPGDFLAAARCGAQTRAGECCRQPAMRNGRCRMHGGLSTGPRTAEGRARCAAARRTHGFYAADTIALRRAAAAHCRRMDAFFASVKIRRAAGHGLLSPNLSNRGDAKARHVPAARAAVASAASSASLRLRGDSSGPKRPLSAGHGVLPSISTAAPVSARPLRPAPRLGFVQRTLLGTTALGLGLTIKPPAAAGHGLLPPSRSPLRRAKEGPSFPRRAG